MTSLRAGFGKVEISQSAVGAQLAGYGHREGGATGVHDPLHARALVLEHGSQRVAICSLELCFVNEDVVGPARERIAARGLVPADAVLVAAQHTHSGPHDLDPGCWPDGLEVPIEAAVAQACERLTPARIGAGFGMLHGHSLNRRRLEDPVDPAVMVVRVDDLDGRALGVWYGFGCHPVVMGSDNLLVSADWPGAASRRLEAQLGEDAVALFGQGCSADVNPLTPKVRERLAQGPAASTALLPYYGSVEKGDASREDWARRFGAVWDRRGGTFEEVEALGGVVAEEALRVHRGIAAQDATGLWTHRLVLEMPLHERVQPTPDAPLPGGFTTPIGPRAAPGAPLEVMLVGIDGPGILLVGEPGEAFVETGLTLRRDLRNAGFAHAFVVTHANGRRSYLPPRRAFPDGGYEVDWARTYGTPETLQDDIHARVLDVAARRRAG